MNESIAIDESTKVSGGVYAGSDNANIEVGGSVGIELIIEAHMMTNNNGIDAGATYKDVVCAEANATSSIGVDGICSASGSATAYAKTGTELEGHVVAGNHGVDVGAEASIGNAIGVDAEISGSNRYTTTTIGAGASIGEHFEAGGSATATCENGIVNVGVAGDVAAIVGIDVDVGMHINTNKIVNDGKEVAHVVESTAPVVAATATNISKTITNTTTNVISKVSNGAKSATNSIKNAFKKIKL
jgi:hypothetical protein